MYNQPLMDNITSLQITDSKVGTGAEAKSGRQVTVHYTGWLYDAKAAKNTFMLLCDLCALCVLRDQYELADVGARFHHPMGCGRVA